MKSKRLTGAGTLTVLSIMAALPLSGCSDAGSSEYREVVETAITEDSATASEGTLTGASSSSSSSVDAVTAAGVGSSARDSTIVEPAAAVSGTGTRPGTKPADELAGPGSSEAGSANSKPSVGDVTLVGAQETADGSPEPRQAEAAAVAKSAPVPNEIKLLVPSREFKVEGPDAAVRVSFDDVDLLKVINMEPVTEAAPKLMPKWLKELDGKRVRLRGFMYPPFQSEDLPAFVLARDNEICCFGRNPKVYDLIQIVMRDGETTNYIEGRPFDVVGDFHIGDSIEPGELYWIDNAVVFDRK